MTDYMTVRISCTPANDDISALLADSLLDLGYDSFEPDEKGLTAYIPANLYDREATLEALRQCPIPVTVSIEESLVKGKDWNEEWEKNYFQPIRLGDRCVVRSSFHPAQPAEYEIVIDPRMAFGTGHHSTTALMISYILDLPMEGKGVIDMGTGTGILSILAAMRGATRVSGIEIDPDAADNARDNVAINRQPVEIITGDSSSLASLEEADYFLANINRNIILADLGRYVGKIKPGGTLLLSGFYEEDIPLVEMACSSRGLSLKEKRTDNNWAAIRLVKE